MDKKEICPVFKAYRTHKVAKQKPAPVLIYDYYDNCEYYLKSSTYSILIDIKFAARRATQFYKAKQTDLCDICDGEEECGEACKIKAQKRISARSEKSQDEETSAEKVGSKGGCNKLSSPVSIFLVIAITKVLNIF